MEQTEGILVAVDDSEASKKAVAYVGGLVNKCSDIRICLLHLLPPIPPGLMEHGGSHEPGGEAEHSRKFAETRDRWVQEWEGKRTAIFEKLSGILTDADIPGERISTCF